jgi:hypothetical protein
MTGSKPKTTLEALRQKHAKLQARISEIEDREKQRARKEDTRLKVIVGAACLADAVLHADTKDLLRELLDRGVTAGRDREFLKRKGWL